MICKFCAIVLVLTGLFTTGCTVNRYSVVHNDQYLVIINGSEKDTSKDDDSDGQVTTVPVAKRPASSPQGSSSNQTGF
ncbi:MAG: hypothetical protein JWM16_1634 [Verrucomicrobiales bacterium]|nr:hypothetical protein [Verrucomicrobiales bacterium]